MIPLVLILGLWTAPVHTRLQWFGLLSTHNKFMNTAIMFLHNRERNKDVFHRLRPRHILESTGRSWAVWKPPWHCFEKTLKAVTQSLLQAAKEAGEDPAAFDATALLPPAALLRGGREREIERAPGRAAAASPRSQSRGGETESCGRCRARSGAAGPRPAISCTK